MQNSYVFSTPKMLYALPYTNVAIICMVLYHNMYTFFHFINHSVMLLSAEVC